MCDSPGGCVRGVCHLKCPELRKGSEGTHHAGFSQICKKSNVIFFRGVRERWG